MDPKFLKEISFCYDKHLFIIRKFNFYCQKLNYFISINVQNYHLVSLL